MLHPPPPLAPCLFISINTNTTNINTINTITINIYTNSTITITVNTITITINTITIYNSHKYVFGVVVFSSSVVALEGPARSAGSIILFLTKWKSACCGMRRPFGDYVRGEEDIDRSDNMGVEPGWEGSGLNLPPIQQTYGS